MKAKILAYPCKGWCVGKTGEAKQYKLPEPGWLVTFDGLCPAKKGFPAEKDGKTICFFESNLATIEILEGFT